MSALLLTRRATLIGFGAMGLAALTGCETTPPPRRFAQITFRHATPIPMRVGSVETRVTWQAPSGNGHIEGEMPINPATTAARWGEDRIRATGGSGRAIVEVREMSVTETKLATASGVRGAFTTDQSERYDMRLVMRVAAEDPSTGATAETTISAQRSQTVLEGLTLAEREDIWYAMIEKLMMDMDAGLTQAVQNEMSAFVLPPG